MLAGAAAGQQPFEPDQIPRLVGDLDADDVLTRVYATAALAQGPGVRLFDLETQLLATDLSPEARRRLMSAAFQRFVGEPRAAMGVSFDQLPQESGVRIATTVPGFHAATMLRPGDRLDSMDGVRVLDQTHAVALIVVHSPGDEVELGINRNGTSMTVTLRLGARATLSNAMPLAGQTLDLAWAIRSEPYAGLAKAGVVVLDSGLVPEAWSFRAAQNAADPTVPADQPAESVFVVAGGEARSSSEPRGFVPPTGFAIRPNIRIAPHQDEAQRREIEQVLRADLQMFRDARDMIVQRIDANQRLLQNPNLPEARRRALQMDIEEQRNALRGFEAQIRMLEEQLRRRP